MTAGIALDRLHDPSDVIAEGSVLWDVVKGYREQGFHRLMIPKAFGGWMGKVPPETGVLLNERFGHADVGLDPSMGMHGQMLAFCPLDLPGISRGKPLNKVGQRALNQKASSSYVKPNRTFTMAARITCSAVIPWAPRGEPDVA